MPVRTERDLADTLDGNLLPRIAAIAKRFPERTIFTRFIPPQRPEDMPGMWRCYYEKWRQATREHIE
jgi:hypothetical protein